jgi:hypothetical protein
MKNRPIFADPREIGLNLLPSARRMPTTSDSYQVHTEARGPHWIAWVTRGGNTKPDRSVVLIAASQAEAEARAHAWAKNG